MRYAIAAAALAATTYAQGGDFELAPSEGSGSGCQNTFVGDGGSRSFSFNAVAVDADQPAEAGASVCGDVVLTLTEGNLVDQYRRTGSIVANQQFQFDGPPQAGTLFSAGWSTCEPQNGEAGHLKLGGTEKFLNCYNLETPTARAFNNIYYEAPPGDSPNCTEIYLYYTPCTVGSTPAQILQAGRCGLPPYDLNTPTANLDITEYPEDCPDAPDASALPEFDSSSSSSSSSSSESASASSTSSSAMSSVSMPPVTTQQDFMTMMTETLQPLTSTPAAVPMPVGMSNTTVMATGTGAGGAASPTGPTAAPSPFTGAGSMLVVCKGFVAMVAGAAGFAMF